ncbi:prephenate dehydrogenase [Paenalkalicoccus suaedae]|uniref:Prephenate dehydrogenase n=1 Tax=Paenalkalicoccus suaedae TaxID=2592382 RepID=A0A859FEH0_9BACI|nr:prephenate dehydrogenase [Paenalkalicoccus suaedae]QKS71102.1 prephenate dehydrogenase [Paenalkalicoccus suaedae]
MSKQIALIGLGLIGGSLALAIKSGLPKAQIKGFDIDQNSVKLASTLQIIDEQAESLEDAVRDADIIILAAPVESTIKLIQQLETLPLQAGAIVTDVGSTKETVVVAGNKLQSKGVFFIGGHPMAGSHKTGVEASIERLFENAYYVLTPAEGVPDNKLIQLQNVLKGTKAKFIQLEPASHDRFAGLISHFPHIVASALVHHVAKAGDEDPLITQLAAGGFRDITRIASASPTMWRDILMHNKEQLLPMIQEWNAIMKNVEDMLHTDDDEAIYAFFADAKDVRDNLPSKKKGAMLPFYDLYVDIPDHPGVISDVTAILAKASISITNIRIIEAREGIMGALRLSFRSEEDLTVAKQQLEEHAYEAYDVQ